MCPRIQTTELNLLNLVSFCSGEVTLIHWYQLLPPHYSGKYIPFRFFMGHPVYEGQLTTPGSKETTVDKMPCPGAYPPSGIRTHDPLIMSREHEPLYTTVLPLGETISEYSNNSKNDVLHWRYWNFPEYRSTSAPVIEMISNNEIIHLDVITPYSCEGNAKSCKRVLFNCIFQSSRTLSWSPEDKLRHLRWFEELIFEANSVQEMIINIKDIV